ncbi:selenocysteine-specific translation elongation factor [Campylobacter sp. VicNov18]|uniref:selenocysteine-specific translation elongation factor n=1 Tax=Campylobacter bilis TaxID=2691918 RepID=UPI00130ED02A|nr:selenocysteine-specific translation elongation factor [Campylobacter bilis]MPV64097.1 selenocysteine-specific translation elongation factor [Campylobacter hepaticus]MBM0637600.1 selenocysteine-specific translation elongation factor [Campylobacter bilis]MCC8278326.1 selenocysteine-specific translation elongation factor [Campylobacter bilis]MCC8299829.1 selenocysteine-specific translation elongation factor [Campylobacter bilis]MCC8301235.1 selenocysteine-specific translation elongation factor
MKSLIIGTAGHIDHGKTSLIKALNGFEGDSLKEEQKRQITINLSFSNLKIKDKNLSFIDVPGHKDLVKTMVSGAFGFSVCLLVVDINEGLKEQSLEHLEILKILNIKNIILVLSKCDLCENISQRSELILKQLKTLKHPILKTFHTSIKNNLGIKALKNYLYTIEHKDSDEELIFHYYIDRVFSLKGIGTVVTGSLNEGKIELNEKIICLDIQKEFLIKSIQNHDTNVKAIKACNRVALSLNCDYKELKKGYLLSKKGYFKAFKECDALVNAKKLQNSKMIFCVGSKQLECKLNILKELDNDEFFVHFSFDKNVFLSFNEYFILLQNNRVIGGGRVLNPLSEPLKKEQKNRFLMFLKNQDFKLAFSFLKDVHKHGFGLLSSYQRFKLSHQKALELAKKLDQVFVDTKNLNVYHLQSLDEVKKLIHFILDKNPYAMLSAHSLALRIAWASEDFCELALKQMPELDLLNGIYFKKGIDFEKLQEKNNNQIYEILKEQGIKPQAPYNIYDFLELDRKSGDNMLKKLTQKGLIIRLSHNLFIEKQALEKLVQECLNLLKNQNLDVQSMKKHFNLSRKYAIAYLEYLDNFPQIIKECEKRILTNI